MLRRVPRYIGISLLCLAPVACRDLPRRTPAGEGGVATVLMPSTDAIPSEWGSLISVTDAPHNAAASILWLQDDSGTIRVVGFDHETLRCWPSVRVIHRR
jgi:hypothetical protein